MTIETMKAGPELDARLCRLLEPKPTGGAIEYREFWIPRRFCAGWVPAPLSTDLGATGKAIEMLEDYDLDLTIYHPHDGETHVELQDWRLDSPVHPIYCGLGQDIPHAFSLALVEALEARAEEQS